MTEPEMLQFECRRCGERNMVFNMSGARLQAIAEAWREYRQREAEPWLREEVEALHDVIALLDGLVGAK